MRGGYPAELCERYRVSNPGLHVYHWWILADGNYLLPYHCSILKQVLKIRFSKAIRGLMILFLIRFQIVD
jgi:hypothetical protein